MGLYGDQTLVEAFGIPSSEGQVNIPYSDSATNSGILDADSLYKITSNNDCHVSVEEDGADLISSTNGMAEGFFLASGEQAYVATDSKRKTLHVQRSTTGGALFAVKMKSRGF